MYLSNDLNFIILYIYIYIERKIFKISYIRKIFYIIIILIIT